VSGLSGVTVAGGKVTIGAMTRHADVHTSAELRKAIPALTDLAGWIGDPMVRHRGTIGGSVANNDPAADYPAACIALGATIVTDKREIAAEDFFTGLFDTALEQGELITKIVFPIPQKAAYQKFRNPASRYAIVGVFVAQTSAGVRVAVTGAGESGVFRVKSFEDALSKDFSAKAIEGIKLPTDGLNSDIHADAVYRAHLINVMARRAVEAAR
jgi:carbon-monoxide dehydrogenase medium subunit